MNNNDIRNQFSKSLLDDVKKILEAKTATADNAPDKPGKSLGKAAKTTMREESENDKPPFEGGHKIKTHKDKYGNTIKNVAKHLARKAMNAQKNEEVYEALKGSQHKIDANKNGKVDAHDFHLLRKKKKVAEEVEELDEISKATLGRYINKAKDSIDTASYRQGNREALGGSSRPLERKLSKRHKGISTAVKKLTKEESEQIDELSKNTMLRYVSANKKSDKAAQEKGDYSKSDRRMRGTDLAVRKYTAKDNRYVRVPATEEVESLDELSTKKLTDYTAAASDARGHKNMPTAKLDKRYASAALAHEKIRGRHAKVPANEATVDTADIEKKKHITPGDKDKLSKLSAMMAAERKPVKESTLTPEDLAFLDALNADMFNEVDLEEARGRPAKAGNLNYTVHPSTKEKLMHDNPEHMKRIEKLQKTGVLQKPKREANQHIIQQLQRAKISMRGGEPIHYTHGESQQVSGTHAAKLLDKYAGLKPSEKEAFQKKIGTSHEHLKSEL